MTMMPVKTTPMEKGWSENTPRMRDGTVLKVMPCDCQHSGSPQVVAKALLSLAVAFCEAAFRSPFPS